MKKEVTLAKILFLPLNLLKKAAEINVPVYKALKMAEEEGLFEEYKGPFCSNVKASCVFNDVIKVDYFEETKQPDGTYLITYVYKYIEEYKAALHIRVLTSDLKKKLKYHKYKKGTELKIKGDLDVFLTAPFVFQSESGTKNANIGIAITVIDFL